MVPNFLCTNSLFSLVTNKGESQNFERPNVERQIFCNLKVANVKSYERSSNSIFLFTKLFFHFFFNYLNTQFFLNFNAPIFYNFPNLMFFGFLIFFINRFCKFVNLEKKFNYENFIIFGIVKILEEF